MLTNQFNGALLARDSDSSDLAMNKEIKDLKKSVEKEGNNFKRFHQNCSSSKRNRSTVRLTLIEVKESPFFHLVRNVNIRDGPVQPPVHVHQPLRDQAIL